MIKNFTNRAWIFIEFIWEYQHLFLFIQKYFAVSDDWLPFFITNWRAYRLEDASNIPSIRFIVYNYVIAKYSRRCGHWLPFLIGKNNFFPLNYCILHVLFKIYIKALGAAYHFSMEITRTVIKQLYLLPSFFYFVTQFHRVKTFTTRKCE